jgi:hypothetical protein
VHNIGEKDGEPSSDDVEAIDEWADRIREFLVILICGSEKIGRALKIEEQTIDEARDA